MKPAGIADDRRIWKAKTPASRGSLYRALALIKEQQPAYDPVLCSGW
jgi:hypothetical protein